MFPNITDNVRDAIRLRVQLRPLLYSLFVDAHLKGYPVVRPLLFHYQEQEILMKESFNFMFGRNLLVVPVIDKDSTFASVLLPQNETWFDMDLERVYERHSTETKIEFSRRKKFFIPLLLRQGGFFVLSGSSFSSESHTSSSERVFYVAPFLDLQRQEWSYWEEKDKKIILKRNQATYHLSETEIFSKIKVIEIVCLEGKYFEKEINLF